MRITWEGTPGGKLDGANVDMGNGVLVELATLEETYPHSWGVWGIRINGVLYREPRDLSPEVLEPGTFRDWIEQETERAVYLERACGLVNDDNEN